MARKPSKKAIEKTVEAFADAALEEFRINFLAALRFSATLSQKQREELRLLLENKSSAHVLALAMSALRLADELRQ